MHAAGAERVMRDRQFAVLSRQAAYTSLNLIQRFHNCPRIAVRHAYN